MLAALDGHDKVCVLLLDGGANPNLCDRVRITCRLARLASFSVTIAMAAMGKIAIKLIANILISYSGGSVL